MNRYVESHARSAFSFLEGAVHPDVLAFGCNQLDIPAMALLDRNGVYGAPFFHQTMKANGLKAHVGAEISINGPLFANAPYLPLLAENQAGYKNLCRLITITKLRTAKIAVSFASFSELVHFAGGLILISGSEGWLFG